MVNEEILTGLRNAVERGESLDKVIPIMIESGYNAKEVKEASTYLSSGALSMQSHSSEFKSPELNPPKIYPPANIKSIASQPASPSISAPSAPVTLSPSISKQLQEIKPKESHLKEIVLVIILLVLLGVLGGVIFFKDKIISFFG
jgi:hypothetical protein